MSTIRFECIEETDELSPSDSPYFLVYVGDSQRLESDVQLVRRPSWDDRIDAGESRQTTVDFSVGGFDLILIALLEEDWDNDFSNAKVVSARNAMRNLNTLLQPTVLENQIEEFKRSFRTIINNRIVNDDVLQLRRVNHGQPLRFSGGGAKYDVTFEAF
jgi:hypothetical protein